MTIRLLTSIVTLGFIALLELTLLGLIWRGRINLARLLSEPTGDASMSRFQLMIFTFVIAVSLFLVVVVPDPPAFPATIPDGILILLGISGTTFAVSKSIQFSSPAGITDRLTAVAISPPSVTLKASATQQFTAQTDRGDQRVTWSIDSKPPIGTLSADGLYTAPAAPTAGAKVAIKATSVIDNRAAGYAEVTF